MLFLHKVLDEGLLKHSSWSGSASVFPVCRSSLLDSTSRCQSHSSKLSCVQNRFIVLFREFKAHVPRSLCKVLAEGRFKHSRCSVSSVNTKCCSRHQALDRSLNLQHCQLTAVMAHHNLRDCQLETREFTSWAARPSHVQPFLAASPTQGVQMQTCYCLPKGLCCETAEKSFCSLAWISIPAQLLPPKLTRYMSSSLPFTIHSR